MSNDLTLSNPFLAPWLRAAQAAGGWPAEMARQQAALLVEWNRQAMALMTGGWMKPAPAPAPMPAPAPAVAETVEMLAEPVVATLPAPFEAAVEAEPVPPAAKPARKPKAVQLRAEPQRRRAAKKAPARKGRITRH